MFYYKITGTIVNEELATRLGDRHESRDERNKCYMVSDELFEKSERNSFIFVSNVSRKTITIPGQDGEVPSEEPRPEVEDD